MKHISFPSIEQFRNVIQAVNRTASFVGLDDSGEPIYDPAKPKPIIEFTGTVKLHGTNAGVSWNPIEGMWAQSREHIITPEKDNAGFAAFVHAKKDIFQGLFEQVFVANNLSDLDTITIYGEWVGKGIQSGVAISELKNKSFFIFGVKISRPDEEGFIAYWVDCKDLRSPEANIYNIYDYENYKISIDFSMPEASQNDLIEITNKVEAECPVAKAFGISGTGEGVVWIASLNEDHLAKDTNSGNFTRKGQTIYRFKVKGEKHSVSKVKTLAAVDTEKINSIKEFVDYAVTENRVNQAIEKVYGDLPLDQTKIGDIIRWVIGDVMKEEYDTLIASGLTDKDVNKYISDAARKLFFKRYNSGN